MSVLSGEEQGNEGMKVIVTGAGPGASDLYTDRMKEAVLSADLVLTAERLAEPLRQLIAGREQIQNQAVSASGAAWENGVLADSLSRKREADSRMTEQAAADLEKVRIMGVTDTVAWLNSRAEEDMTVCVAASGDTGFYSIASTLKKRLHPNIPVSYTHLDVYKRQGCTCALAMKDWKCGF